MNKSKKTFSNGVSLSLSIQSTWKANKNSKKDSSTQTDEKLYQFEDMETQTSKDVVILEYETKKSGLTLLDQITNISKRYNDETELKTFIEDGFVKVDYEVCKNPNIIVERDAYVEIVISSKHMSTQTSKIDRNVTKMDEMKEDVGSQDKLIKYLNKITNTIEKELKFNLYSKAFLNYDIKTINFSSIHQIDENITDDSSNIIRSSNVNYDHEIKLWKTLQVDLEKYKVIFPDWTNAKYCTGRIARSHHTRTKERVYDIDYDDGSKLKNIREEYIRILIETNSRNNAYSSPSKLRGLYCCEMLYQFMYFGLLLA